jgi:hypothetical protein
MISQKKIDYYFVYLETGIESEFLFGLQSDRSFHYNFLEIFELFAQTSFSKFN